MTYLSTGFTTSGKETHGRERRISNTIINLVFKGTGKPCPAKWGVSPIEPAIIPFRDLVILRKDAYLSLEETWRFRIKNTSYWYDHVDKKFTYGRSDEFPF